MSRTNSFSSIEESADTKVHFSDLTEGTKSALKTALKSLKREVILARNFSQDTSFLTLGLTESEGEKSRHQVWSSLPTSQI